MAAIVNDTYMQNLLKTVYENDVINNKAQSSPVISEMKKEDWVGGKELRYSTQYLNGGLVGSHLLNEVNQSYSSFGDGIDFTSPRNAEWIMTYGFINSYFDVDSPDILASSSEKGAYMSILANKMAASFDLIGKNSALYLYGGKYGVIEELTSSITIPAKGTEGTLEVSSAAGLKLQPGIRFVVADDGNGSSVPSSALLDVVCTVTKIDDSGDKSVIHYLSNATAAITTSAKAYIELFGARASTAANAEGLGFEGLYDILPTIDNRSGTVWDSYIATPFRGIDRSQAVSALAGQFVKAESTGDTRRLDALVKLLKKTQRYGGIDDVIIINDDTLNDIYNEMDSKAYLRQSTDGATAGRKSATKGFNQFSTAFGDSFIDRVARDPYVMNGKAYMISSDDLVFQTVSNAGKVFSAVGNGQLGKYDVKGFGDQGVGENVNSGINYDKLFTIVSNSTPGIYDYGARIVTKIYGNYKLKKTGASGVAVLD